MFSYKQIENILNDMFYAHTSDMCSMYTQVIYVLCTQVIFERCSEKKEDKILLDIVLKGSRRTKAQTSPGA